MSNTSPARALQDESMAAPSPAKALLSVTLRCDNGYEYHLDLDRRVVDGILSPDVPDAFIEVPCTTSNGQRIRGRRRFLHTSYVKEIEVGGMS